VLPATSGANPRAPNSAMSAFAKWLLKGAGAPSTQNRRSDPGGAEPTEVGAGRRRENVPPCICCIDSFEPFLGGSASIGAIGRARSVCGTRPPPAVHPAPAMGRKVSDELTSSHGAAVQKPSPRQPSLRRRSHLVGTTGYRSHRHIANALGLNPAHRMTRSCGLLIICEELKNYADQP
jgi:hypothetical protein